MSYCLNPNCSKPENPKENKFCQNCGTKLLLKERYRALKLIGQGGFGKTFLAVDEDIPSKPPCVIKLLLPPTQGSINLTQKATQLFEQEAVQLDKLGKHPQIPELLAHFEQDDRLYLIQEFIDGQNLAEELKEQGVFNETKIRELLNSILPVLQFVHENQVIHRDIKPENIIRRYSDNELVLVDFGAAKFTNGVNIYETGTIIGTPGYAAPEQSIGKATFNSDLYSLGVTCIHLFTQIEPFDLFDITESKWAWQDYLITPVSKGLAKILNKMIHMATKRRYQSATEILEDLDLQPTKSTRARKSFNNDSSPKLVGIEGKYGYINNSGEMIIPLQFEQARRFQEELAAVKIANKWGYIDTLGRIVISPQYKEALNFSEGLAAFRIDKWLGIKQTWGYIDKTAQVVIPPQYSQAFNFSEDLALVRLDSLWSYIDKTGQIVITTQFTEADNFKNGLARVMIGSKWGFINKTGKIIIAPRDNVRPFSENLAAVESNKQWGYINTKGVLVIQPLFKAALDFAEGLAPVLMEIKFLGILAMGQKWGYINKTGEIVIEPQFDWCSKFSQGRAAIKKNDLWGYINKTGQIVIPPQFELASDFDDGMAEVVIGGQYRYIDKTGKFVY